LFDGVPYPFPTYVDTLEDTVPTTEVEDRIAMLGFVGKSLTMILPLGFTRVEVACRTVTRNEA
jgi:hypothetical protein